ncbi:MAG: cyclase/dehydrase [Pedosphaera sp.]|nr:cyclase/dehydrase [Pedosphaera sp.]
MQTLTSELWLPAPREKVFSFFADAQNLETITPPWLQFHVLTRAPILMKAGTRIDCRLKIHGLPARWQSEITLWEPSVCFVDVQRRGPYRTWIHMHTFEDQNGGTLAKDQVHYAVPGGRLIDWLFVRRDVKKIFDYRSQKLKVLFSVSP